MGSRDKTTETQLELPAVVGNASTILALVPAEQETASLSNSEDVLGVKIGHVSEAAAASELPPAMLERFEAIEFLGQGGMGTVYKAKDRRLGRHVALKMIHGGGPEVGRRFLLEARAQARIEHEHVCKIYEVGAADGQRFIVMQLIDGKSLDNACVSMTLEQKVKIVQQVALALHEAHRMGMIHRDIKPSNIMVERCEDGSWKPYVMDFGLAREMDSQGHTATGAIAGTPAFMAPEQARGEIRSLDRRTDVYSLGATLYDVLSGHPPFKAPNLVQLLWRVGHEDAPLLRSVYKSVPIDLETIVMKCLEREPNRRYESARAFADDLGRYLDGEPIQVRRASLGYVLLRKAKKHKLRFALILMGLVVTLTLISLWGRARRIAAEQAELSGQLGQDIKEMELLLRWAQALPLHNLNREKTRIRDRMGEIEGRIEKMGRVGQGPGHYALGRGYLALHEPEQAREHLQGALAVGYGGAEVERALGKALGEIYRKELEETNRIGDKKPREARRAVIEKELLEPALEHLRRGGGEELESGALMEGLMAFYQKNYDVALEKAKESEEKALSTYEATKLRADIYSALGTGKKEKGQGAEALLDYERAAAAYELARGIARSDAAVYEAECEMWVQRMEVELNSGKNPKTSFEKAINACDGALVVNPESGAGHGRKAWALWRYGAYLGRSNENPSDMLLKAIQVGKIAVRMDPRNANNLDTIGIAYSGIGRYEMSHGSDPRESFRLAAEYLEKAIEMHPNFAWAHNDLGGVYRSVGEYEASRGMDPGASFSKSISFRQKAIELDPAYYYPYTNMGIAHGMQAQYNLRFGRDPSEAIRLAIGACERSLEISKSYFVSYDVLGLGYILEAQYKIYRSEPFEASIEKALEAFDKELRVNSSVHYPHVGAAMAHMLVAREALIFEKDASMSLEKAGAAIREAEKTGGSDPSVLLQRAKWLVFKARYAAKAAKKFDEVEVAFRDAEEAVLAAKKMGAGLWEVFELGAELSFWEALELRRYKKNEKLVGESIKKGIGWADEGLAISPEEPSLLAWKGTLLLLSVRVDGRAEASEEAHKGRKLLDGALQKNPFLRTFWQMIETWLSKE